MVATITDVHRLSAASPRALLFNGTVGAGKTSVAAAAGRVLAGDGVSHAVIDLDAIGHLWPAPADDPFKIGIRLANLSAMARNYIEAKAKWLLVSGVVETRLSRDRYRQALGVPVQVCRLRASGSELSRRLRSRHADEPEAMAWHLDRAGELDEILDAARVDDFEVQSTGKRVGDVAVEALGAARGMLT